MRILIIGARGQLGCDLVDTFSDCKVTPYTTDDMNIVDEAAVQREIAFTAPDLVINAAAFTRVDDCEREHITAYEINALGPRNLALACKRWDIPLVHISTNYVFDGNKAAPYDEDDITAPLNSYGISKLAGEHFVKSVWDKNYIVRVSGLFGINPSRMKGTNFIEAMLRLGSKGSRLRIVCDESLTPTYTIDAAAAIRKLVETSQYGLYHLSNTGTCTWSQFAEEIFQQAGLHVEIEPVTAAEYGAPAKRPLNSCLENNNLSKLNIAPQRSWQDALADYLSHRQNMD